MVSWTFGHIDPSAVNGHMAMPPDGRCFAVGGDQPLRAIAVFETATLRRRHTILSEHGAPTQLAFSPGSRFPAAAQSDGTVLVYDLRAAM